ncbi:unnamed protein product [Cuscuta campestris]|uniref:FCP1 homology domain-containing protein n=1 Tax=Cuscuta campestris TaxID=132261 RepID=A0A484LIY1_9ASTE|nr:unnamed protein product [Cuscuta campestris]
MGDLYALDFDGVLCDSCGESSLSALKAAKVRWPSLFETVDSSLEGWIVDQMHIFLRSLGPVYWFYPGVPDALKFASSKVYIVTTKQSRFADALLRELAGVTISPDRIYGLGTGPKVQVLKQLQEMPENKGLTLHFVEDRLATLKNVIEEPELDGWNLYLVRWGYNTPKEREEAATIARIRLLELSDFSNKLK